MSTYKIIKYPNNIKELRTALQLTQQDIVVQLQLTNSANRVSKWEHGTMMPSGVNLLKLPKILGVQPSEIYPTNEG